MLYSKINKPLKNVQDIFLKVKTSSFCSAHAALTWRDSFLSETSLGHKT